MADVRKNCSDRISSLVDETRSLVFSCKKPNDDVPLGFFMTVSDARVWWLAGVCYQMLNLISRAQLRFPSKNIGLHQLADIHPRDGNYIT
jgi:hypothetical protein